MLYVHSYNLIQASFKLANQIVKRGTRGRVVTSCEALNPFVLVQRSCVTDGEGGKRVVAVLVLQKETSSGDQIDWVTHATLASSDLGGLHLMVLAVGNKVLFCSCYCVDVNGVTHRRPRDTQHPDQQLSFWKIISLFKTSLFDSLIYNETWMLHVRCSSPFSCSSAGVCSLLMFSLWNTSWLVVVFVTACFGLVMNLRWPLWAESTPELIENSLQQNITPCRETCNNNVFNWLYILL